MTVLGITILIVWLIGIPMAIGIVYKTKWIDPSDTSIMHDDSIAILTCVIWPVMLLLYPLFWFIESDRKTICKIRKYTVLFLKWLSSPIWMPFYLLYKAGTKIGSLLEKS